MANNMINNKHIMVLWHVENLKVSYINSFEIIKFEGYMSTIYGGIVVHRRKVNNYLVMDLGYREQVTVKVSIIKYLDSVIQEFPENLGTIINTKTVEHLFTVYD